MTEARLAEFGLVWERKDLEATLAFFTEDARYLAVVGPEPGRTIVGAEAIRKNIEAIFANDAIAPLKPGPVWVFDDGRRGVAEWTLTVTEADGVHRAYRGIDLFEFDGDRISVKDSFRKIYAP